MTDAENRSDENHNNPDTSETHQAAPEVETESPMNNERRSTIDRSAQRNNRIVYGGILVIAVGLGFVLWQSYSSSPVPSSSVARPPNVESTPGGEQQGRSERYQNTLDQSNEIGAKTAFENDESFIATPDEAMRSIDTIGQKKDPPPVKRPVAPANVIERRNQPVEYRTVDRRPPPKPQTDYRRIDQLASAMSAQQQGLLQSWQPVASQATVVIEQDLYTPPEPLTASNGQGGGNGSAQSSGSSSVQTYAVAGDTVMARIQNASDSDTPGPVIAEIINGPLDGARAIGAFEVNKTQSALVIQFDRIVMPDGANYDTSAYAIDAQQSTIAVKTDIDRRYFQRYGGKMAAAFISGLSGSLSEPQQQYVGISDNIGSIITNKPTVNESIYAGFAAAGDAISSDLNNNAPSGPLVKVRAGQMIGILFLENVGVAN